MAYARSGNDGYIPHSPAHGCSWGLGALLFLSELACFVKARIVHHVETADMKRHSIRLRLLPHTELT